jgi:hypothetical protein
VSPGAPGPREMFWELVEDEGQRRKRALLLRLIYALVDPTGWDARRLSDDDRRALALLRAR